MRVRDDKAGALDAKTGSRDGKDGGPRGKVGSLGMTSLSYWIAHQLKKLPEYQKISGEFFMFKLKLFRSTIQ